jgi:hypothetical protein
MTPKEEREALYERWELVNQQLSSLEHRRGELTPPDYEARSERMLGELEAIESRLRALWSEERRPGS